MLEYPRHDLSGPGLPPQTPHGPPPSMDRQSGSSRHVEPQVNHTSGTVFRRRTGPVRCTDGQRICTPSSQTVHLLGASNSSFLGDLLRRSSSTFKTFKTTTTTTDCDVQSTDQLRNSFSTKSQPPKTAHSTPILQTDSPLSSRQPPPKTSSPNPFFFLDLHFGVTLLCQGIPNSNCRRPLLVVLVLSAPSVTQPTCPGSQSPLAPKAATTARRPRSSPRRCSSHVAVELLVPRRRGCGIRRWRRWRKPGRSEKVGDGMEYRRYYNMDPGKNFLYKMVDLEVSIK